MNITEIVVAAGVLAATGLLIGLLLGAVSRAFAVESDEREIKVRELLPGINCGACGYAGCEALAAAIAKGEAPANACPVGKAKTAQSITELFGE